MVFNATFNNISVISWRQFCWWRKPDYPEKTTDLSQYTDKNYHLLTLPEHLSSSPVSSGVRVTRSLVLCVCFVDSWLSFLFWSLCCLSFDLRILITSLVYSNSYRKISYVEVKYIPIRHIRNCLISNLDTGTLIK